MRRGFTFIEMIFVIVIIGVLAKFGSEIFRNVYLNYNNSKANNELQIDTELTLQQIANRLQYRIKDSVIGRRSNGDFTGLSSIVDANYTAFEWVGYDIDGWLGNNRGGAEVYNKPTWTGFIDVDAIDTGNANVNTLFSPDTDTNQINAMIGPLSASGAGTANSALFFTGGSTDIRTGYDWDNATGALTTQNNVAAHRITTTGNVQQFADLTGASFAGTNIYEQYTLSWTAYALSLEDFDGDGDSDELVLYYDYRPWEGQSFTNNNTSRSLFIDNVTTVKLRAIGDMINIQICISENNITGSEYSICKEKAIF